jgi:hypothetical protein
LLFGEADNAAQCAVPRGIDRVKRVGVSGFGVSEGCLYQRLYHRCMSREDSLSSRFDYLFEPLDDEESINDAPGDTSRADDRTAAPSAAPVRLAFAAFVLGTLGVVAVVAVLLVQHPNRTTDHVQIPLDPSPLSTSFVVSSQAVPVPPPPDAAGQEPTEAPQTTESVPEQRLPAPAAPADSGAPATRTTHSPATRAPISVAPRIRAPVPSQAPGGHGGGGLLGGGLL